jgi:hypothetical protein
MKSIQIGLTDSTTTTYDKTQTTLFGRAFSKTINSQTVLGPPLTNFIDVFTQASITPSMVHCTENGNLFAITAVAAGLATIAHYTFDLTGQAAPIYVGKIIVALPNSAATTHTLRSFKVYDGATSGVVTGWQLMLGTTGSVLINGGSFVVNNIAKADFVQVAVPTIGLAIASNAKAVYMLQDPGNIGVNNNLTAHNGAALQTSTRLLFAHSGLAAANLFTVWDTSATLNVAIQTTTAPTVVSSATFTLVGHGYNANDPVVLLTNVPTGFTATTATVQTVYFVRNPAANTFELSATSGGASILATSIATATTITRAFGTTTSAWISRKTGVIAGVAGVLLNNNSEKYCVPTDSINSGFPCIFFATTTNLYLVKLSDLTNGATNPPSLTTVNTLGSGTDYTTVTPTFATFSTGLGQSLYVSNASSFYAKYWINSQLTNVFGGLQTTWLENTNPTTATFAAVTILSIESADGWLFAVGGTVGQRGIFFIDVQSDENYDYSYVVSPILDTDNATFQSISTLEQLFDLTNSMKFSYRTAATDSDPIFDNPGGAWTEVGQASVLTSSALNKYSQFRVDFYIASLLVNTPSQIHDLVLSVTPRNDISSNWVGSVDNTTANSVSPAYTAFRLVTAYSASVPTMYFRAYDDNGTLVASANTSSNPTFFKYSTNNGTSWNSLGTVPNTALTTELRYEWATPPGVKVTCSIRES